jgi:hypothetical protein
VREVSEALAILPPGTATVTVGYAFPSQLGYMPKEAHILLEKKSPKTN